MGRDAFCHACGAAFEDVSRYPRTCSKCRAQVWANPIPVSVVLVPARVDGRLGLMVVRRAIEPQRGKYALVGGFLEEHERWQEGGAREVREETGVEVAADKLVTFWFTSTEPRPNRVLLFSIAEEMDARAWPGFTATNETDERGVIFGPEGLEGLFAFPLHVQAAQRFFTARGVEGPHEYRAL
ncbi:MAG: NUDIX domain-containing protein [Polyangiales bacterium]